MNANVLTTEEAAKYLGLSVAALKAWRRAEPPRGPKVAVKMHKFVRYTAADLDEWLARGGNKPVSEN